MLAAGRTLPTFTNQKRQKPFVSETLLSNELYAPALTGLVIRRAFAVRAVGSRWQ